jgi:hypothetical protein
MYKYLTVKAIKRQPIDYFFTFSRRTEDIFIRNFHNILTIIHINNCFIIIVIINMTAESFFARNMPTFLLGAAFLVTYWSLPQGIPLLLSPPPTHRKIFHFSEKKTKSFLSFFWINVKKRHKKRGLCPTCLTFLFKLFQILRASVMRIVDWRLNVQMTWYILLHSVQRI